MGVFVVAGERGVDAFDGVERKDGDAVVGLLGDGCGLVAELGEVVCGEVGAFQLLQQEGVRPMQVEPLGDVGEAGANAVDVPGGDLDGGVSGARSGSA